MGQHRGPRAVGDGEGDTLGGAATHGALSRGGGFGLWDASTYVLPLHYPADEPTKIK